MIGMEIFMITTKQRAFLRGRANTIDTIVTIGKGGITENIIKQTSDALECREIVKGKCLETSLISSREAVQALAEACGAEIVQTIGNKFVLYRPAKEPKIVLP